MFERIVAGRIVTGGTILEDGWIAISEGSVAALGTGLRPAAAMIDDYGSAYILPGMIDGQTHAGSQIGLAGLAPTTRTAVRGGVTTIVDMPYDEPDPMIDGASMALKVDAIGQYAVCDVALYATVPAIPVPSDIMAMVEAGACAFKISSFEAHPTRFPRIDNPATLILLETLAGTGLPVGLHNEDQEIVRERTVRLKEEGKIAPIHHSDSRPPIAERVATANFLELGASTGTPLHIVHLSIAEGFDVVRRYRDRGIAATGEMCVHYLYFDAEADMPRLGGRLKVNPPIRTGEREALWRVLDTGGCAFVSSDHSAWPLSRKGAESIFDDAAGMPGLDTLLPVFFTAASARHGQDRAAMMAAAFIAEKPADFFGLSRKGRLAPGMDADIAVLAPDETVHNAGNNPDGPGWSAYDGERLAGQVRASYVRGERAWDGTEVAVSAGHGRFVTRTAR